MSVLVRSPGRCMAPADALAYIERLKDCICTGDETEMTWALNTVRYALARNIQVAPKFEKGRNGPRYDRYTCLRCGWLVGKSCGKYCENCGQRLSDNFLGRRKTKEEQRKYASAETLRAMDELEQSFANGRSPQVSLEDFI